MILFIFECDFGGSAARRSHILIAGMLHIGFPFCKQSLALYDFKKPDIRDQRFQSTDLFWGQHHAKPKAPAPEIGIAPVANSTAHVPLRVEERATPQHAEHIAACI